MRNANGKILSLQGFIQDITHEKDNQFILVQLKRRFHQLADAVPQIIWTAEANGTPDYTNKAFLD